MTCKFEIDPLEERIAPSSVNLSSLADGSGGAPTASGSSDGSYNPNLFLRDAVDPVWENSQ